MPRYLAIYGIFVGSLIVMLIMPGLNLRIHHYILGLLLLPGTAFQNRPSLIYQGLLLGLFINGVARWGFASILETSEALLQGDHKGTLLPAVSALAIEGTRNITFGFGQLPVWDDRKGLGYQGVSVLVNDVERFRGYEEGNLTWSWERRMEGLPEYFRFAYLAGSSVGDYSKAGKWDAQGEWIEMEGGASR